MVYNQLHRLLEEGQYEEAFTRLQGSSPPSSTTSIDNNNNIKRNDDTHASNGSSTSKVNTFSLQCAQLNNYDEYPLHMACDSDNVPDYLILEILRHHTGGAFHAREKDGNMPLHLAVRRNLGGDVIEGLIRENPSALDHRNGIGETPRDMVDVGGGQYIQNHDLVYAYQAIKRPTSCWHQLMEDEALESEQDKQILILHERTADALTSIHKSNDGINDMLTRLEYIEKKLREIEDLRGPDLEQSVKSLQLSVRRTMDKIESRLSALEDDVRAEAAKEYMARAASRAHQSDVVRMQKKTAEEAKRLKKEVEDFTVTVQVDRAMEGSAVRMISGRGVGGANVKKRNE